MIVNLIFAVCLILLSSVVIYHNYLLKKIVRFLEQQETDYLNSIDIDFETNIDNDELQIK